MANRSVLRVGYVSFYFPSLFFDDKSSTVTGIYPDIWRDYARITKKELVFVKKDDYGGYLPEIETGFYAGMLGDVEKGELDGVVDAYSSQPERIPYFKLSKEVDYTTECFFEADSISLWPYLTQYFIFDGWTYLCIGIFVVIFHIIFLLFKLQPLKSLNLSKGTNVVNLLFITMLFLFYNAEFNAITIVPTFNISTNFRTLVDGLHNGQRRLVTTNSHYLRAEHLRELFGVDSPGPDQYVIEPNVQVLFDKLCADSRLVYYDADSVMISTTQSKLSVSITCPLRKIDTSDLSTFPVDSAVRKKKFGEQKTYVFYLNKEKMKRKDYEKFVDLQLKLYRYEQMIRIHLRKYKTREGSSNRDLLSTNRVTFSLVAAFLIAMTVTHFISLILFGIECVCGYRNVRCQRLHVFVE